MKDHLTRHFDQRLFRCEICTSTFKKLAEFNKHISLHNSTDGNKPTETERSENDQMMVQNIMDQLTRKQEDFFPQQDQIHNSRKSSFNTYAVPPFTPNQSHFNKFFNQPSNNISMSFLQNSLLQDNFLFGGDDYNSKIYNFSNHPNRNNNEEQEVNEITSGTNLDPFSNNLFFGYGLN